jgi:hypothetical protein
MSGHLSEEFTYELQCLRERGESDSHRYRSDASGVEHRLPKPCCLALVWLGRRLIAWGEHLQAKYGHLNADDDLAAGAH